jgi:hypothetical protein
MTRKSKHQLEREVEELSGGETDATRPFTAEEHTQLDDADNIDVEQWSETGTKRAMARALTEAAREASE